MSQTALETRASESRSAVEVAVESLHTQARALDQMANRLGVDFARVIDLVLSCSGRVIVSGMGKSGLVGKKIAATFASTGTLSFFIHPGEAFHGDLGMITGDDLILLISYSGETEEVVKLLPSLKDAGNPIISIVGNKRSTLAKHSNVALDAAVERETCPNNLAPTTSALAIMALGDAMAVALIKARDFKPMDFARFHPGGSLGRRLLIRVRDAMHRDNLPLITPETSVRDSLFTMTSGRLGLLLVMQGGKLEGILTDGDLRRAMMQDPDMLSKPVSEFITRNPVTVSGNTMLAEAEIMMRERKVRALVVTGDRGQSEADDDICGVLEIFD